MSNIIDTRRVLANAAQMLKSCPRTAKVVSLLITVSHENHGGDIITTYASDSDLANASGAHALSNKLAKRAGLFAPHELPSHWRSSPFAFTIVIVIATGDVITRTIPFTVSSR